MQAQITLKTRDLETGEVVGEQSTTCATEDGQTFVIAPGSCRGWPTRPPRMFAWKSCRPCSKLLSRRKALPLTRPVIRFSL
jgi:hypothetical protein